MLVTMGGGKQDDSAVSLADVDELYIEQKLIAAEMHELIRISRRQSLTSNEEAKLSLLTAQLLAIPKKIAGLLRPAFEPE